MTMAAIAPIRAHPRDVDESSIQKKVFEGLVAHYYGMALVTATFIILGNSVVGLSLYLRYFDPSIAAWTFAAVLLPLVRGFVGFSYQRDPQARSEPHVWERRAFIMTTLIACVYGLGVPVLFVEGDTVYNGVLTIWYVGMISATCSSAFALRRTMVTFCAILGASIALRLAFVDTPAYHFTAAGVVIYSLAQVTFGLRSYRLQSGSLRQSVVNEALAARLESQVEIANAATLDAHRATLVAVRASEEAMRASREKSRFLAAASHDLRQPLHALSLSADALKRSLAGTPFEQSVDQMIQSCAELGESLKSMLDISQLDAGVIDAKVEPVRISDVFAVLASRFSDRAGEAGLGLRFVHRDAVVLADRQILTRLLSNLIDNALKYTRRGGVLVAVRRSASLAACDLTIEVRDSGVGIPADCLDKIFDEFYQVENPGRVRAQGLGLGLSIVRRLAKLMDMHLRVASRPNCGSKFSVECNAASASDDVAAESAQAPQRPLEDAVIAGRRILVVDNEAAILRSMNDVLAGLGATVHTAAGVAEALAIMEDGVRVDLIFVDYRLDGNVSGVQLAAMLKRYHIDGVALIIVTGDTSSDEIRATAASGSPVLFKPLSAEDLVRAASSVLGPREKGGQFPALSAGSQGPSANPAAH